MFYKIGRNNLALTVFVPYDCTNSCRFCTSKKRYKEKAGNLEGVIKQVEKVMYWTRLPVKDVVFTGGEPMENVEVLKKLVEIVPKGRNVYINTTFTKKNMEEFVDLVNSSRAIKGVNISRHGETFARDEYLLGEIAEDKEIFKIKKPVRINCLAKEQDVRRLIDRWTGTGVELSMRRDYRTPMTETELHSPYDHVALALVMNDFRFVRKTQCNVCDTTQFEKDGMFVRYHKGLEETSIDDGITLEINDLIIDQAGDIAYDWKECDAEKMKDIMRRFSRYDEWDIWKQSAHCECGTRACGVYMANADVCGGSGCG